MFSILLSVQNYKVPLSCTKSGMQITTSLTRVTVVGLALRAEPFLDRNRIQRWRETFHVIPAEPETKYVHINLVYPPAHCLES